MPAFQTETELFDYYRRHAQALGCNPCFDKNQDEIRTMNEDGSNGVPNCLCKVNVPCPCAKWKKDSVTAEPESMCYCEIFVKV